MTALLRHRAALPIILCLTFISRIALMFRSDGSLASRLFLDDSYYVFSCARNIAKGLGLSVDGLHPTNGLQPLIAYIYSPFFLIAGDDRWLGLRLCFIPLAIIDTISVWLLYSIVRKIDLTEHSATSAITASMLWLVAFPVWSETMNGLETGISGCLLLAAMLLIMRQHWLDRPAALGVLLGFAVLARIDTAVLVLMIVIVAVIQRRFRSATVIAATSSLISLPWWYYNLSTFGSLMPSSGYAQSVGSIPYAENFTQLAVSIADISFVLFSLPYFKVGTAIVVAWTVLGICLCALILFLVRRWWSALRSEARRAILVLLCFGSILAAVYTLFFHAPYFIHRYLHPLRIIMLILVALTVVRWIPPSRSARHALLAIAFAGIGYSVYQYQRIMLSETTGDLYKAGLWARDHADYRIGMMQSGIAGFTADNVVNLDGKMNFAALEAIRHDSLGQYIRHERFTHLMDWDQFVRELSDKATAAGACYELQDSIELVRIYRNCEPR